MENTTSMRGDNLRDPITLKFCKNPVRVITADGKKVYWEAKTVQLAYQQQYNERLSFATIEEKLSKGGLYLITPRGCFNVFGGRKITSVTNLDRYTKDYYRRSVNVIASNLNIKKDAAEENSRPSYYGGYYGASDSNRGNKQSNQSLVGIRRILRGF